MKILLTGATGFLGYRTLEKLVMLNYVSSIIATGRTLLPYRKINNSKIVYEFGSLEDNVFVEKLVIGVDIIINTASLSSPWGNPSDFKKANIDTQSNLIQAAKKYGVKKFIYISSPSVYFNGKNRNAVKESDPLPAKFVNEYAKTKRQAEILLENSQLPYVILRPRALIGRGDSVIMPRLIRAFDEGKLRIIGRGINVVDLTSVDNVVEAIHLSIHAKDDAVNQIYNITNDEPTVLWKSIQDVLSALNKPLNQKKIPYYIVFSYAKLVELKARILKKNEPTLTAYGVGTLALSFTLDITKAKTLLGYRPVISTKEAIDEFVKWYSSDENL